MASRGVDAGQCGLKIQPLAEQPLDDRVVQITRYSFTILGHHQNLFRLPQGILALTQLGFAGQAGSHVSCQRDDPAVPIPADRCGPERLFDGHLGAILAQQVEYSLPTDDDSREQ
jgi:hypothetical protein